MSNKSVSLQSVLLNSDSDLGRLIAKGRQLQALNEAFATLVGLDLAQFCTVESFESGSLLISVPNAGIATRLRFMEPQLLSKLRKDNDWKGLCNIKICIAP